MPSWIDQQIQKQRFAEMVRIAERDRLAQAMLAAQPRRRRFHNRLLASLGRRLVAWGYTLQLRYDPIGEPAMATKTRGNVSRR